MRGGRSHTTALCRCSLRINNAGPMRLPAPPPSSHTLACIARLRPPPPHVSVCNVSSHVAQHQHNTNTNTVEENLGVGAVVHRPCTVEPGAERGQVDADPTTWFWPHDSDAIYGCSAFVLVCFTCPATTVVTVISRALDRVRGWALGQLGPGSPKSQPHQALRGIAKPTTGWVKEREMEGGPVIHDFATAMTTVRGGDAQLRTCTCSGFPWT